VATEARFFAALRMTLRDAAAEIEKLFLAKSLGNLGGMATEARFFAALRMTLCDAAAEIGKLFVAKSSGNRSRPGCHRRF